MSTALESFSGNGKQLAVVETASSAIAAQSKAMVESLCSVALCGRKSRASGMCNMHYKRVRRTGSAGFSNRLKAENGVGHINSVGYHQVYSGGKLTYEHIVLAEKALGKKLPLGACVHHFDENKSNNEASNLVICQDEKYHRLIHKRMRALRESGNPNHLKCPYCKKYDAEELLTINESGGYAFHPPCHNQSRRIRRALKRGQSNE